MRRPLRATPAAMLRRFLYGIEYALRYAAFGTLAVSSQTAC